MVSNMRGGHYVSDITSAAAFRHLDKQVHVMMHLSAVFGSVYRNVISLHVYLRWTKCERKN